MKRLHFIKTTSPSAIFLAMVVALMALVPGTVWSQTLYSNGLRYNIIGNDELEVTYLMHSLKNAGFDVDTTAITVEEAVMEILSKCNTKPE